MPIAPHRIDNKNPDKHFFYFYRTLTSMDDFVEFVKSESTQVKTEHDFFLCNDKNRTV
jgi:hypothetical protein